MSSNDLYFEPDAMGGFRLCTISIYLDAYDFLPRDFSMEIAEVLKKMLSITVPFFCHYGFNEYHKFLLSISQEVLTVSQGHSVKPLLGTYGTLSVKGGGGLALIANATTRPLFPNGCGKTMNALVSHTFLTLFPGGGDFRPTKNSKVNHYSRGF